MQLIVGTNSSWSLRVWVCMRLAKVNFTEHVIDLASSDYKTNIFKYSPSGLVPALIHDDLVLHDSLSIAEYLNETAGGTLLPKDKSERALARSLCCEMHSGFTNIRSKFPFTLDLTPKHFSSNNDLECEIARIEKIFGAANRPFMFGSACTVDAFYSILAFRLNSYGLVFDGRAGEYQKSLLQWELLNEAIERSREWR